MNDSAFNVVAAPAVLFDYGRKLGLSWPSPGPLTHLHSSGYVVARHRDQYLVMDIGLLGPDYQPAHGHCDLFSFECSVGPHRIVCDSGVYAYEDPGMRPYVRSTAAHNTLRIDGEDQSEMWGAFRVARRAKPYRTQVTVDDDGTVHVVGSHDGYDRLPGHPIHQRELIVGEGKVSLLDSVVGKGTHKLESFLHFHPQLAMKQVSPKTFHLFLDKRHIGRVDVESWQEVRCLQGWYCPEFGKRKRNTVLTLKHTDRLPFHGRTDIRLHV